MHDKIVNIQGLRFIAFLLIFLIHSVHIAGYERLFDYGGRGVEIFFVLSGYLMAYNFSEIKITYNLKSSLKYMLQKVRKFYILHLITFIAILLLWLYRFHKFGIHYEGGIHEFILDGVLNLTLLQSWYDPAKFSFNGVSWFLSSIIFMYFCTPYLIHACQKMKLGGVLLSFFAILIIKMILDTSASRFNLNPLPGFFHIIQILLTDSWNIFLDLWGQYSYQK